MERFLRPFVRSSEFNRWQRLFRVLTIGLLLTLLFSRGSLGQEPAKRSGLSRLFQRNSSSAESSQPRSKTSQPGKLIVIDRATAQQNARQNQFRGNPATSSRSTPILLDGSSDLGAAEMSLVAAGQTDSQEIGSSVTQAAYQDFDRRMQTPSVAPLPYERPIEFGSDPSYQREIYFGPNRRRDQNSEPIVQEPWNPPDEGFGQNSSEHPSNQEYGGLDSNAPREPDFYDESQQFGPAPQIDENGFQGYDSNGFDALGRGYLNRDPTFRNESHNRQLTATERALALKRENEVLLEKVRRLEGKLSESESLVASARAGQNRKDEELKFAADRIEQLEKKVNQLTTDRDNAIHDRIIAEQNFNKQLREIEAQLDGVLLNELSQKSSKK